MAIKLKCDICENQFSISPYRINTAKYCSTKCRQTYQAKAISGSNCHFYKGGKSKTKQGYIEINREGRSIYEHRYIMEQHIGRPLTSAEQVHHINGIKTDNSISNLQLLSRGEHQSLHGIRNWGSGLMRKRKGMVLTWEKVDEIRRLNNEGSNKQQLSLRFNVSIWQINAVINNRRWLKSP